MAQVRWGYQTKIIERALLITMIRHPECNVTEIYEIVSNLTAAQSGSMRRAKSMMIQRLKKYADILEDSE